MPQNPSIFLPAPTPVVEDKTRLITRAWLFVFQSIFDALVIAGDVFGPGSSVDNQIALFSGTTGKLLKAATGTGYVRTDLGVYSTPTHAATSVLGRSANSTGDMADIAATANGQVLVRQSGALVFANQSSIGYWAPITSGSATNPELIFDSNGECVVGWVTL